jgi:hypothetical protein
MANMSYCRFENTLRDLHDCHEALRNLDFPNQREKQAARDLLILCQEITEQFKDDNDEMELMDPTKFVDEEE